MDDQKVDPKPQDAAPARPAAPAAAPAPAARPAAPPKVEPPSLPPLEMISPQLKAFLEEKLKSGEDLTIEVGKEAFKGRLFRLMLHEGWLAMEHVDGRRKAFMIIVGGRIAAASGVGFDLPGGHK